VYSFPRCLVAVLTVAYTLWVTAAAPAQVFVMMPDSTNNRIVLFDPNTGALVNNNYFALLGGTPIHAMQVNNEVWVSEQVGDRVARFTLTGTFLGQIGGGTTGGLDNIRGMGQVGNTVYVCNAGTGNTAPGNALVMYDTAGNSQGFFLTPNTPGPFGILDHQGTLLVSANAANDDVHRYSVTGTPLGTFHNSTSLNFGEQLDHATNGDVLVAGFSSNNVVRLDPNTGALLGSFTASGARGVFQLGNGNILWSSGAGVSIFDVTLGTSSNIYTGGGRYFDVLTLSAAVPEPAGLVAVGLAGAAALGYRRRRRRRAKRGRTRTKALPTR
jgi:sugar lactone lactonase YvrE